MNFATIGQLRKVFDDMQQKGIIGPYAVGGAFAATLHNEPIATADLDIFFLCAQQPAGLVLDLSAIYDYARELGFGFDHEFVEILGWLVQFVESSTDPLWRDAIKNSQTVNFIGVDLPVIRPDYLVAMWLQAGRPKDYDKIRMFADAGLIDFENLRIVDSYGLSEKWEKAKHRLFHED